MSTPHDHNRRAWDTLVRRKQAFTIPAADDDFHNPAGLFDPRGWLEGPLHGKRLLCLAAGGGKHGPLYAAAGAEVTVLDLSPAMLELDRLVAQERNLSFRIVAGSMDDLSMFSAGEFDIVIHPVSTCYVPAIEPVYREVARVLGVGGLYISQHKSPVSLQAGHSPHGQGYGLTQPYYRTGPLPPVAGSALREEGTLEYLHRWEEILGYLCRSGFSIEDVVEPLHADADAEPGSFGHRCRYIAPYVRIKARRRAGESSSTTVRRLVLPD